MTLLRLNAGHRAAIIELGMNHPGEIAYLTAIARPTVALVTNAQRAHLAGMGTIDAIAAEKGSVYHGLAEGGVAVINIDDRWADLWREQSSGRRVLSFAFERPASHRSPTPAPDRPQCAGCRNRRTGCGCPVVGCARGASRVSRRQGAPATG